MQAVRPTFAVAYGSTTPSAGQRRRRDPVHLLAILSAMSLGGMLVSGVRAYGNSARLARYEGDPGCRAALGRAPAFDGSACSVDSATVTGQWYRSRRSSSHYRVALRTADGVIDSVEITSAFRREVYKLLPVGTKLRVQRFTESPTEPKRHVSVLNVAGLTSRTDWNPRWRASDAKFDLVFASITSALGLMGLWIAVVRRRRASS